MSNPRPRWVFPFILLIIFSSTTYAGVVYARQLQGESMTDGLVLTWSTFSETDSDHFIVERSVDGFKFEQAMKIEAAGQSKELKNYRFIDLSEPASRTYYRLQQVDYDGTATATHITWIEIEQGNRQFQIQALNAFTTNRYLTMVLQANTTDALEYRVMTRMGAVQLDGRAALRQGINVVAVDLKKLEVGTYQLALKVKNEVEVFNVQKVESKQLSPQELATKNMGSNRQ